MDALDRFKKLMNMLKFESRKTFDEAYYWYKEQKIYHNGVLLPASMEFHITIKTIPSDIEETLITTKIVVPANTATYDLTINPCIELLKHHFKYELRNIKVNTLLKES